MPIDPTGTAPGLPPKKEAPPILNMKCRRDGCASITVFDVSVEGPAGAAVGRRYQCTECRHTWGIQTGGAFNIF